MRRTAIAAVLAVLIGLAGCGGSGSDADGGGSPGGAPSAATPTGSATAIRTIRVEVKDGAVVAGGGRHTVKQGSRVVLRIVSDKPDEVHLHGYDEEAALEPGRPTRIEFTADIPGVFEVELHESGLPLCELQVQ